MERCTKIFDQQVFKYVMRFNTYSKVRDDVWEEARSALGTNKKKHPPTIGPLLITTFSASSTNTPTTHSSLFSMIQPQLIINLLLLPLAALAQLPDDLINVPVHFKSAVDFTFIRVNPWKGEVDRVENHGGWETAIIRPVGDVYAIVFETDIKAWYLEALPGEHTQFETAEIQQSWELFTFEDLGTNGIDNLGNNLFGIRSQAHGTYLGMNPHDRKVVHTALSLGPWEKFYIHRADLPLPNHIPPLPAHMINVPIRFKAVSGNGYIRVNPWNGQVDRTDNAGGWETATIRPLGDAYGIEFATEQNTLVNTNQLKPPKTLMIGNSSHLFPWNKDTLPFARGNMDRVCVRMSSTRKSSTRK